MNITLGGGKAVHVELNPVPGYQSTPDCGGNRASERYRNTDAPVTCKRCLKIIAAAEAAAAETTSEISEEVTTDAPESATVAPASTDADKGGNMRFSRETSATGTTQYRAEGESFRYTAERQGKEWTLTLRRLETVGTVDPIRVAEPGTPYWETTADTLTLAKAIATEFETLGDGYRSADHGHRDRITEAVLRAYGDTTSEISEAAGHQAPESANVSTSSTNHEDQGENTMSETTTTEAQGADAEATAELTKEQATAEQIEANIERAGSLAEAENVDGLKELEKETEALISSLPQRGKLEIPGRDAVTYAKAKKDYRDQWRAAAQAKPKAEAPKATKAVAKKAAATQGVVVAKTWDQYEGTKEFATLGAEKLAEGVRLNLKVANVAEEVAKYAFEAVVRIPNKDGNPDIMVASDAAKKVSTAIAKMAGEGFEHTWDNEQALKKFTRSVQDYRSDARAAWLRSLDEDTEEGAERRARVSKILEGKPEGEKASEWVAKHYGTSTIGQAEKKRLAYHEKQKAKELEAAGRAEGGNGEGGEGESEGEGSGSAPTTPVDPDEYVTKTVGKIYKDVQSADPDTFEKASEGVKKAELERLEKIKKAVNAMIATLV